MGTGLRWAQGVVTPAEFDAAWPGGGYDPTAQDVVDAIQHPGISSGEAIRHLYRGQHGEDPKGKDDGRVRLVAIDHGCGHAGRVHV
jgi:hypothetical protein